jgi:hypothetical protein
VGGDGLLPPAAAPEALGPALPTTARDARASPALAVVAITRCLCVCVVWLATALRGCRRWMRVSKLPVDAARPPPASTRTAETGSSGNLPVVSLRVCVVCFLVPVCSSASLCLPLRMRVASRARGLVSAPSAPVRHVAPKPTRRRDGTTTAPRRTHHRHKEAWKRTTASARPLRASPAPSFCPPPLGLVGHGSVSATLWASGGHRMEPQPLLRQWLRTPRVLAFL